jgi:hypothetical protein
MSHNGQPALSPVLDIRDIETLRIGSETVTIPVEVLKELERKLRAKADDCDQQARCRNNNQWFRGCANGYRLAAGELFFAVQDHAHAAIDAAMRQEGE